MFYIINKIIHENIVWKENKHFLMDSTIFPPTFYSNEAWEKRENDKGRSVMTQSNDTKEVTTKEKNGIKAP